MVFHEVDSITDVINGHRIIIYYIQGRLSCDNHGTKLCNVLESVMEMLEKKNDDLLIIKILQTSKLFNQLQELYLSEVAGAVTLFVVNNEGIPVISEHINEEGNIASAIEALSIACKLNSVPNSEITKMIQFKSKSLDDTTQRVSRPRLHINLAGEISAEETVSQENLAKDSVTSLKNENVPTNQPTSTELQIRLPNGDRDKQKFNKDAMLQEVWVFISVKYNLKEFDLKTYNHQAFSEDEYVMTLQDLDLYPNGVIIVVSKNIVPFNSNGWIGAMVQNSFCLLKTKTIFLFRYIHGLLFMIWNSLFFPNNNNSGRGNNRHTRDQIRSQESSTEESTSHRKSKKSESKTFGNIHTLRRIDDSDDENNRYNGNSTQQK